MRPASRRSRFAAAAAVQALAWCVGRRARLGAVVVVLALAGCTGGGSGPARPGDASRGGGVVPGGRVGGTLAVALLDPGPLDPATARGLEDEVVLGNLFDGLTVIDPTGAVRPATAASWTSDPSLRQWEFRLRPEARWSDGSQVTSADFLFAWHRLASPRTKPRPYAARTLLADLTGYGAFAGGRARTITGLTAPDPSTLRVALDRPFADLPAAVAALPLSPLPRSLAAGARAPAYLANPVGDGPFRLAARPRPGRPLALERNPAHWADPPRLDRVSVHPVPDEQTAWLELQHGLVAFAPVPPNQLAGARTLHGPSPDGRTQPGLLQGPTLTAWSLTFNLSSSLGRDPRWRQAVSLAMNRLRLAATVAGTPAVSLLPPAMPGLGGSAAGGGSGSGGGPGVGGGADPGGGSGGACAACDHDPGRARSLLAEVKAARGPVRLAVPPGPDARQLAARVAADLSAVGIKVTPEPTTGGGESAGGGSGGPGGAPLSLVRWVPAYPRPDAALTAQFATRGPANLSGYRNPAVDRLLDQARTTPDDPTRVTHYREAEAAILADLPATPLLTEQQAAVLTPGLQGFDLTPWSTLDLAAISLSA